MGLILKTLASVAALSSLASTAALPVDTKQLVARDACADGPHGNVHEIGGNGGTRFCESRIDTGEIISALDVWWNDGGIQGISFDWSSGKAVMHGTQPNQAQTQSIKFAPGERVQEARLWGDGTGVRLGHIYLKTDRQTFDVGKDKKNNGYDIEVGSGLLLGAYGNAGDSIDSLALLFLGTEIVSASIADLNFDKDPTGTSDGIKPHYLVQTTFGNPSTSHGNVSFTISASEAVTTTTSYEQSTTGMFGGKISVEVDATLFGLGAKVGGEASWSVEHATSNTVTETNTITISQGAGPISIAPGFGKKCQIFASEGMGSFTYTSTVTLKLKDGSTLSYKEPGKLNSVQYSEATVSCVDANSGWDTTTDNPPTGVKIVSPGN